MKELNKPTKEQPSPKQGEIWRLGGNQSLYIYALVDYDKFCFVSLEDGNRWSNKTHNPFGSSKNNNRVEPGIKLEFEV